MFLFSWLLSASVHTFVLSKWSTQTYFLQTWEETFMTICRNYPKTLRDFYSCCSFSVLSICPQWRTATPWWLCPGWERGCREYLEEETNVHEFSFRRDVVTVWVRFLLSSPSYVLTASRFMTWRMMWYSSAMPFPPSMSLDCLAMSRALPQLFLFSMEIISGEAL